MEKKAATRVYYLDWLRVLGILVVFVYHSSRFFNVEDWFVKNPIWYPWVEVWNRFATAWMMPLMFAISGASLFYALGKGGAGRFVKDKVLRLLVPVLVCDLTHASVQMYLDRLTHGQFTAPISSICRATFPTILPGTGCISGTCGCSLCSASFSIH